MTKRSSQLFNFALFSLLAVFMALSPTAHADRLLDKVVAVVNDQIVLQSQLQQRTQETAQELMAKQIPINSLEALQAKVLDNMIMEILQKQRAQVLGLSVSDEEVNEQLLKIANQNQLSILQLRDRLNAQAPNGFSQFRDKLQQQILIQKLRDKEIISRTMVTQEEIDNYLQRSKLDTRSTEYHLRHILITLPESATEAQRLDARNQIDDIARRLNQGESFSQLAVRYSKGSKALSGGDLGWLKRDQIPTFFSDALDGLEEGQTSDVISSPSGFHLIKLVATRDSSQQTITQYHLHRFMILSDQAEHDQVPLEILQLVREINSVDEFNKLKEHYSDLPAELNANMDLGWQTAEEMTPALQRDIGQLAPEQMAPPVPVDNGWVLFFVEGIRQVNANEENERQQAIQAIRMRKANETFEIWLRRLKDEAFIDIRL